MLAHMLKLFLDGLQAPELATMLGVPMIYGVPLLIVLIALYQGIGSFLGNYYLAKVARGVVHDLRCALFDNLLTLPNRYFDNHNSGHLISRITYNVTMVTGAATDAIKVVIREGLTVLFLFGYLLYMNWKLTLVLLSILPVIALMVGSASRKFRKQSKKIQVAMGDVTHVASETIQGYRVVRSFGGEPYEQQRFHRASADNMNKSLKMTRTQAVYTPMLHPGLAESIGGLHKPEDLLRLRIIDPGDIWWSQWFREVGVENPGLDRYPRSRLNVQAFEAAAAIASQGVAMLTPELYADEIALGRLYQPFEHLSSEGKNYWLVYPENRRNIRKIRLFRDWILKRIEESRPQQLPQNPMSGA